MSKRLSKIIECLVVIAIIAVLVALLGPAAISSLEPRNSIACRHRLQALNLALQGYHEKYGSFPPAYVPDEQGRPMHSWRVLILPFLDQQALYDEYRFDEPWDGPHNVLLHDRARQAISNSMTCPGDWKERKQPASYLAVVGPHSAWPGSRPRTRAEFTDGLANTLLIVEVHDSGIEWFEPRDLNFDEMCFGINDPSRCGIRSTHFSHTYWNHDIKSRFANVLYADGSFGELADTTPPRVVQALLTADGAEKNIVRP